MLKNLQVSLVKETGINKDLSFAIAIIEIEREDLSCVISDKIQWDETN